MKIFLATSYSSKVDYETGEILPEYRSWLKDLIKQLESYGHTVFCAPVADNYRINHADPAEAFSLDESEIEKADVMLAFVNDVPSAGIQTEIGMMIAKKKPVVIAHSKDHELKFFNQAIIKAGQAKEAFLPIDSDPFANI